MEALCGGGTDWQIIKDHIRDSWDKGKKSFNLKAYFFVVLVLFGCLGFWETIYCVITRAPSSVVWGSPNFEILFSLNTIAPSIAAAACLDLALSRKERCFIFLALVVGIVILLLHFFSFCFRGCLWFAYPLAFAGLVVSCLVWFIVNANNPNLTDGNPRDSFGGDDLDNLAGSGINKGLKV